MRKVFTSTILILCVLICCFSGCGKEKKTQTTATTKATTTTQKITTTTANPNLKNPYTGEYDIDKSSPTRPVTVVVGNNWKSRPQVGIEKADMYFEIETEGGITRFLTVFANADRLPDKIGPVRSARTPSVKVAYALESVYCHAGGSVPGKAKIKSLQLADLDGCTDSAAFWRDQSLLNSKGMEYSMMTGKNEVVAAFGRYGYDKNRDISSPFVFGDKKGNGTANKALIQFSGYQTIKFEYDAKTKLYTKSNWVGADGIWEKHVSANGTSLDVSNIIICYASKSMENDKTCDFSMESGTGYVVSGGTYRDIQYSITNDGVKFQEEDGTDLTVATGKTYVCIVNNAYRGDTEFT